MDVFVIVNMNLWDIWRRKHDYSKFKFKICKILLVKVDKIYFVQFLTHMSTCKTKLVKIHLNSDWKLKWWVKRWEWYKYRYKSFIQNFAKIEFKIKMTFCELQRPFVNFNDLLWTSMTFCVLKWLLQSYCT